METRAGPKTALNYFQPALWTRCRDIQQNMTEKDNLGGNGGMTEESREAEGGCEGEKSWKRKEINQVEPDIEIKMGNLTVIKQHIKKNSF